MSLDLLYSASGQGTKDLPSVITSVVSAAVKNDVSSMQEDCFVGSHRDDIGRQETNPISIIYI